MMLNSFLKSVIQLFKESGNYDVSESEDNGQAVTGSEVSSGDGEIISEMSSKDLMKANGTSLSDDVETACNAMAKLEIQISGSQNDTVHAKRVTGDESNATQMITNFGSRSPTPLNGEYRTHVNIGVQTVFEGSLEPAKQKCGDVSAKQKDEDGSAKQKEENVSAKQNGDVSAKQKGEDASVQPKGGGTLRLRDWDSILISERLERCLSSPNVLRSISIQDKSMKISRKRREKKLHTQYRRPMLFSKKLEKCRSLPNLFRTSSIQDKSMKIARKRRERKHARQRWIRSNSLSSESDKESKEINMNAEANERKTQLEPESGLTDSHGSDVSFNSLVGELSDDVFDDYYTYNREYGVDDAVKANSKNCKTANLRRISTIQKRAWLIRQRRRGTLNKFRSMET